MRMHLQAQSEMHLNLKLLIIYSLYFDRDVKNLIFLVFCPWVTGFCQKNRVFEGFCYMSVIQGFRVNLFKYKLKVTAI